MTPAALGLDVDGTLIPPDGALSSANHRALARAMAAGVRVVFVTGKSWPGLSPLPLVLGAPGPHICVGGAQIVGSEPRCKYLPDDVAEATVRAAADLGLPFGVYLDNGLIRTSPDALADLLRVGEPRPLLVDEAFVGRPLKVLCCLAEGSGHLESALRAGLDGADCQFVRTSPLFYEVMPSGVDKGVALADVLHHLGCGPNECVVVGDAQNDVPMLELAAFGAAMPHAPPALKAVADVVVPEEHRRDGVAWVVDNFVLESAQDL